MFTCNALAVYYNSSTTNEVTLGCILIKPFYSQQIVHFLKAPHFVFLFALLLIGCQQKTVEDNPERRMALATEMSHIILSNGAFDAITNLQLEQSAQLFAAGSLSDTGHEMTQSEYQKLKSVLSESFSKIFPIEVWGQPFSTLYAKYFSADELDQLVRFYKSPAGLKSLQIQNTLTTEGVQIGQRLYESKKEEFRKVFAENASKHKLKDY